MLWMPRPAYGPSFSHLPVEDNAEVSPTNSGIGELHEVRSF